MLKMMVFGDDGAVNMRVGEQIPIGGGTSDHNALRNRELSDQHPIASITGLDNALSRKADDPYAGYTLLTGTAENPLDFDTITTPGFYKFTIPDDDTVLTNFINFPTEAWGFCTMEVWNNGYFDNGTWIDELYQSVNFQYVQWQGRTKSNDGSWSEWDYIAPIYNDIPANSFELGGIMADPAESGDTQPVRIGEDSKLYTAPGGNAMPMIQSYTISDSDVMQIDFTDLNLSEFELVIDSPKITGTAVYGSADIYLNGLSSLHKTLTIPNYAVFTTLNRRIIVKATKNGGSAIFVAAQAIACDDEFNKTDAYKAIGFTCRESITEIHLVLTTADRYFNAGSVVTLRGREAV